MATLTLMALEKYMRANDDSLFDHIEVPEGLDEEVLVNDIILRAGEFEVLYPDPTFLKLAIHNWFKKYQSTFNRWYEALSAEYNPIENYDRYENSTKTNTGDVKTEDIAKVSAYNEAEYSNSGKNNGKVENNLIHGNIGVTTSTQMVENEVLLRQRLNIINMISDMFVKEFCLMIY